jgi:hypothetical protein
MKRLFIAGGFDGGVGQEGRIPGSDASGWPMEQKPDDNFSLLRGIPVEHPPGDSLLADPG